MADTVSPYNAMPNNAIEAMQITGSPNTMNGRRRPQREWERSDQDPIRGSAIASMTRDAKMIAPATAGEIPATLVR